MLSDVVFYVSVMYDALQAERWMPTMTKAKTLSPFKVQLQEEYKAEIKCRKIRISNERVSNLILIQKYVTGMYVLLLNLLSHCSLILFLR